MQDLSPHYHRQNGTILIEIRLDNIMQLFNSLDPFPFHGRDLDRDAEEYIVGAAREFALKTPLKLVLYLASATAEDPSNHELERAIHHYFLYKAQATDRKLRLTLRQGRLSLMIGLAFLFACLSLISLIGNLGASPLSKLIQEGLLIGGWVALWRPIEIFLYDWWPIRDERNIYAKLSLIEVELRRA